jgi:hypothetical protein
MFQQTSLNKHSAPLANSSAPGDASECIMNSSYPPSINLVIFPLGSLCYIFLELLQSSVISIAILPILSIPYEKVYDYSENLYNNLYRPLFSNSSPNLSMINLFANSS